MKRRVEDRAAVIAVSTFICQVISCLVVCDVITCVEYVDHLDISSILVVVDVVNVAFFSGSEDPVKPAESLKVADSLFTW